MQYSSDEIDVTIKIPICSLDMIWVKHFFENELEFWFMYANTNSHIFRKMIDLFIDKFIIYVIIEQTRTTTTPAFWDTPTAPWLPILVKKTKSKWQTWKKCQKYKFGNFPRNVKRYTSEVDSIIDIKWAQPELKALQNGRTDRRTDGRSETNIPPPPPPNNFVVREYNNGSSIYG